MQFCVLKATPRHKAGWDKEKNEHSGTKREYSPQKTDKELLGGAGTRFISVNLGTLME